jgi:hypothetical protein
VFTLDLVRRTPILSRPLNMHVGQQKRVNCVLSIEVTKGLEFRGIQGMQKNRPVSCSIQHYPCHRDKIGQLTNFLLFIPSDHDNITH